MSKLFEDQLEITDAVRSYIDRKKWVNDQSVSKLTIDESGRFDTVVLVYISDLHIGTPDFDLNWLIEVTNYVLKTPNAKVLLLGDLLNTAVLNAVSNMYEDLAYPEEQWQLAVDLFSQLAAQEKIIAICAGNHERRVYKQTGIETIKQLATAIKAEHAYAPYYAERTLVLKCDDAPSGKFTIPIVSHHGDGAQNIAGVKKLQDIDPASYINAVGHLHREQMLVRNMFYTKNGKKYKKSVLDIMLPSAGGGYYAKEKMLKDNFKSPYFALELTAVKNPRYEKFKDAEWREELFVPAVRTIPIMQAADTAEKNVYIKTASKIIGQHDKEMMKELMPKIAEIIKWMTREGIEIKNEIKTALKELDEKEKKKSSVSPKPVLKVVQERDKE